MTNGHPIPDPEDAIEQCRREIPYEGLSERVRALELRHARACALMTQALKSHDKGTVDLGGLEQEFRREVGR